MIIALTNNGTHIANTTNAMPSTPIYSPMSHGRCRTIHHPNKLDRCFLERICTLSP